MKERLINFETAKLAQEKGFVLGIGWHGQDDKFYYEGQITNNFRGGNHCAPTQSLLQRWLREVHNIHIEVFLSDNLPYTGFYYRIMTIGKYFVTSHDDVLSDKFEDALEKGLFEALKLITLK